jgi:hypothetical protein
MAWAAQFQVPSKRQHVKYLGVMAWAAQFQVPSKPQVEYLGVMAWAAQYQVPSKPQRRVPGHHGVGRTVPGA